MRKHHLLFLALIFLGFNANSQIAALMRELNGKNIEFKCLYDSVKADQKADSAFFITNDKHKVELWNWTNSTFPGQTLKKTKVDFYINNGDTLVYIYSFFKGRFYEVEIISTSDSINLFLHKSIKKAFDVGVLRSSSGKEVKGKTRIVWYGYPSETSKHDQLYISLVYAPARPYLPTWCGTGRKRNWEKRLTRILTRK